MYIAYSVDTRGGLLYLEHDEDDNQSLYRIYVDPPDQDNNPPLFRMYVGPQFKDDNHLLFRIYIGPPDDYQPFFGNYTVP